MSAWNIRQIYFTQLCNPKTWRDKTDVDVVSLMQQERLGLPSQHEDAGSSAGPSVAAAAQETTGSPKSNAAARPDVISVHAGVWPAGGRLQREMFLWP